MTPRHPLFINRPKRATLKIMAGQKRRSGFKRLLRGGRGQGGPAAGEIGVIRKPHHGRIRIALCYPNAYELAMGNLGFHQAYHLFNLEDDVACERAMLDSRGRPLTIESGLPLREFEIIAFSISYEADLMNLAMMLHQSGVPLSPEKRRQKNSPLVLVGGVMAFLNPEPLAPFADVIAVGEGEAIIPPLLSAYRAARERARPELLAALARAPGVYIPSFYDVSYNGDGTIALRRALHPDAPATIRRTIKKDLSQGPACTRVFSEAAEFGDMALVELGRGCVQACRFCAAAYIYRPPRWTGAQAVEAALEKGFELRSRAGLVAASVTDHPEFARIRSWVRAQGRTHSLASLRLDQITSEILADIKDCGLRTITLAPETGAERLRRVIGKPFTDRMIARAMEMIGESGLGRVKLYFQVGLPTETREDVEAMVPLIAMMRAFLAKGAGTRKWPGKLQISINPFVPKPGTPFQWRPMQEKAALKEKLALLQRALKKIGGVSVSGTPVREALFQGMIARGDRRTGRVMAEAVTGNDVLSRHFRAGTGLAPPAAWYLHRERARDEILPWDFIGHGVSKQYLWDDAVKAEEEQPSPPCRPGKCARCDACADG